MCSYGSRQPDVATKAAALRQAQLSMLDHERFRHPYYCAPFILTGQ